MTVTCQLAKAILIETYASANPMKGQGMDQMKYLL